MESKFAVWAFSVSFALFHPILKSHEITIVLGATIVATVRAYGNRSTAFTAIDRGFYRLQKIEHNLIAIGNCLCAFRGIIAPGRSKSKNSE